jgi:hypothetical protein
MKKKAKSDIKDDLQAEYDLKSLRVRKLGSGRKSFGGSTVRLEPDVAEIFSSADAVNEALRFLIAVMQQNQMPAFTEQSSAALEQTSKES